MSQLSIVHPQRSAFGMAAGALLAAAVIPMVAAQHTGAGADLSADVALTSAADVAGAAAYDLGAAFDFNGLLHAELEAGEGLFNDVIGFPGAVIGDVVNPVEDAFNSLIDLNFGEAFSDVAGIPVALFNTVIDLPIDLVEGVYSMALTIPGEYLFNFGEGVADTTPDTVSDTTSGVSEALASIIS